MRDLTGMRICAELIPHLHNAQANISGEYFLRVLPKRIQCWKNKIMPDGAESFHRVSRHSTFNDQTETELEIPGLRKFKVIQDIRINIDCKNRGFFSASNVQFTVQFTAFNLDHWIT